MSQASPDPVYAAIRAVEDALAAAEANPHREELVVAISTADRAFLSTVPTTRDGLTAYVDFYVDQVRSAGNDLRELCMAGPGDESEGTGAEAFWDTVHTALGELTRSAPAPA